MKVEEDQLVRGYLARLEHAARVLPADRRLELLGDVAEHLAVSMAGSAVNTEADRRQVLDRLGAPEEIVLAALEEQPIGVPPLPPRKSSVRTAVIIGVSLLVLAILALMAFWMLFANSGPVRP